MDSPPREVGVLTVDDQPSFRSALRDVIRATRGFRAVAEAASGTEALAVGVEPELVLMDVWMPGENGIDATRRLLARWPRAVVFLISVDAPEALPPGTRTCGAAAVLRKQDLRPQLLTELWRAHAPRR
jgi:two-component system, NarL family, invasion response regulator UvrY